MCVWCVRRHEARELAAKHGVRVIFAETVDSSPTAQPCTEPWSAFIIGSGNSLHTGRGANELLALFAALVHAGLE